MKKGILIAMLLMLICIAYVIWMFERDVPQSDPVQINDIVRTVMEEEDATVSVELLTNEMNQMFAYMDTARRERDQNVMIFFVVFGLVFLMSCVFFYFYYQRVVLAPFHRLQNFAKQIAMGNLEIPLEMDKNNIFGAFTESFDIMREELAKARDSEYKANLSKKELIASLSHDIKTPIASIKAVTELMLVKDRDEKERTQLTTINEKAEQINALITDMFHATLEELEALPIFVEETSSVSLPNIIRASDYNNKIKSLSIPECLVLVDTLRLQQIFDNIISNSYKYANTEIECNAYFEDSYLVISLKDFGNGVSSEELPLIFNKFYRGKDAQKIAGYGLGLYISRYFMEEMDGKLEVASSKEDDNERSEVTDSKKSSYNKGFEIKILLKLS